MQTLFNSTAQTGTGSSNPVAGNATGNTPSDLFTTLLVAQIRNQNPLDPVDPSEFVGQLTQLSQMEALQSLASQGAATASMLESMQVLALGAQVGSAVTVRSNSLQLGDAPVKGRFELGSASSQVALVLTDAAGAEYRIALGTQPAGEVAFVIDPARQGLPAGQYALRVETDGDASPGIDIVGELQNVRMSGSGSVIVNVAGLGEVSPSLLTGFYGRQAA